jgi:hypothetical protein
MMSKETVSGASVASMDNTKAGDIIMVPTVSASAARIIFIRVLINFPPN